MKRIFFVVALIILFVPRLVFAEAIGAFSSSIVVSPDANIAVTETIVYDFGDSSHHGIFRDIPYTYKARGGNFTVQISNIAVTDEAGAPYAFTVSNSGSNKEIKIGDANSLVTGSHTYVLHYTVSRAINYFQDHDELYWNVTGNGWQVPMQDVSAKVTVAGALTPLQVQCYMGPIGSNAPCDSATSTSGSTLFAQTQLQAGEGLTIVVGFPKGLVHQPTAWERLLATLADNWGLGLPVLTLVAMLYVYFKKGRDPAKYSTIVPQYEAPKDVTPTEAGTIIDSTASNQDISSEIINLAVQGYITITRLESKILGLFNQTDYQLDKLKDSKTLPNEFERIMMDGIFAGGDSIKLSSLKNTFYTVLSDIKSRVYRSVVDKGFFAQNPNTSRGWYIVGGIFLAIGGIVVGGYSQNVFTAIGVACSGIIIAIIGASMSHRSFKGAEMKSYILGLKMYLSVAEKERLKFFNAPDKTPKRFEALLPYAMVLGVEKEWAKQFEGIYTTPPSWYHDPYGGAFNAIYFASALHDFRQTSNSTFASQPRSSASGGGSGFGGGGSGGGFGGGGGGSW